MQEEIENTGKQEEIRDKRILNLLPYQYKKGQSGNPSGRPKGISLKEYAKSKLVHMTEEEREEFFNGIDKRVIWEMAEGKADTKTDITSDGKPIIIDHSLIAKNATDNIPKDNS